MLPSTLQAARRALASAAVACGALLAAAPSPADAAPALSSTTVLTSAVPNATSAAPAAAPRRGKAARRSAKRARSAARAARSRRAARSARLSRSASRAARSTRSARATRATRRARSRRLWTAADAAELTAGGVTLRGSRAAVDRAYDEARSEGLEFTESRGDVLRGAAEGEYISLRGGAWRLKGVTMPYARPETRAFLAAFAPEYRAACGEPLTVTSAMRPTSVRLRNSVAKTVHPTGIAVDLRAPRSRCRSWMRRALLDYERRGVVEATEERRPAHFHVAVLRAP